MRRLSIAFVAAAACLAAGGQVAAGAGGAPGPYRHTVDVELTRNVTNNANTLGVKYRFCFDRVVDEGDPFRLAQFIQKTSFAECCAADYPGNNSMARLSARYLLPGTDFVAAVGGSFGETPDDRNKSYVQIGGLYYLWSNLGISADVTIGKVEQTRHSTLVAGARWLTAVEPLGCPLEVFAAFRLTRQGGDETSGVAVDMRYFWDKRTFTGLHFTTDTDKFSLSGGIWTGRGFRAEIEAGNENKADFLTLTAGLAF